MCWCVFLCSNTDFGASVASSSSEYCEAQCWGTEKLCYPEAQTEKSSAWLCAKKTNGENGVFVCSFLTFCENQSGGRPGSEKGLMALLTDTLEDREKYVKHKCWDKTIWK